MLRLVVVNPVCGNAKGERYLKGIKKVFENIKKDGLIPNDEVVFELTKCVGDATVIVKEYIKKYAKEEIVVYVVGGDGTLGEVATACINVPNISIVAIPKGTGNDFSRMLNEYTGMRKIIHRSLVNEPEMVDSILLNKDKICINVLNTGLDAAIADNMNLFRKWRFLSGSMKYKLAIVYTLFGAKQYKLKVRVDDKIFKRKFTLVAIGNSKYYGGGVEILPSADMANGMLELCLVDATTMLQKLRYLPKIMKGKHEKLPVVHMLSGREISIVSYKKIPVSIDGEIIHTNRFKAKILEKSIKIIKTLDK